jgi:hypothetical protein
MLCDESVDPRSCLLWRIRGIDDCLYAMFLRRADARWALDLHRDGRPFATFEHPTREKAMRDARQSFVVCQLPPGAVPLWQRTTWDGHALVVYISRHADWWRLTVHRDGILWQSGEFESEAAALTDAALTYEDCQRPPWPHPTPPSSAAVPS